MKHPQITCDYCLNHMDGNDNIHDHPDVRVAHCPICGGTDWAATKKVVRPESRISKQITTTLLLAIMVLFVAIGMVVMR